MKQDVGELTVDVTPSPPGLTSIAINPVAQEVWVAVEHNSGGAGLRGVYRTREAAEATIDQATMKIVHESPESVVWSRKDKTLSVTIRRQSVEG